MRLSGKKTSNQDGLLRYPTVNKVRNYPKNNGLHKPLAQRPEWALLWIDHCSDAFSLSHAAHYFRINTHQDNKAHAKEHGFGVAQSPLYTGSETKSCC